MAAIPNKVKDRLVKGLKRFQTIVSSARSRDVNESDTVTIVTDIISEILGYDKYTEISSEHSIKGTFCDLVIEVKNNIILLIEVKAIGLELKDNHVKQAIDYASNCGSEWVALTNGVTWKVYRVIFSRPIDKELVLEFDFLHLNHKSEDDLDKVYILTKEGRSKSALKEYHSQRQAMSRYSLGSVLMSESVMKTMRKELKKLSPDVKIELPEIKTVLMQEVLKRDVVEGEKAEEAQKKFARIIRKERKHKEKQQKLSDGGPDISSNLSSEKEDEGDTAVNPTPVE